METRFKLNETVHMDGMEYDHVNVSVRKNDNSMLSACIHYEKETEFGFQMSLFGCQMQHFNICKMPRKNQKKIDTAMQYVGTNKDTIVPLFVANKKDELRVIFEVLGQSL